ncbi:MAG: LPXTG cell wall anchor domain-containing protein [Sporichthyaceae bacterium]
MSAFRTRTAFVAAAAVIAMPLGIAFAGTASAADLPVDLEIVDGLLADTPVAGVTDGLLGDDMLGGALGVIGGVPVAGSAAGEVSKSDITDLDATDGLLEGLLGDDTLEIDLDEVVDELDLRGVVKELKLNDIVDLDDIVDELGLDRILGGLTGSQKEQVKGAIKKKVVERRAAQAGALPKTGGSANMTAMLLCAGLAAAGTGVTLVTRRRNAMI